MHAVAALAFAVLTSSASAQWRGAADPIQLAGTLRVVDKGGLPVHDGTFALWLNFPYGWDSELVSVRDGRWLAAVRGDFDDLRIGRMLLDGRFAGCEFTSSHGPPKNEMTLEARWLPRNFLHVVDAATGLELASSVEIVSSEHGLRPSDSDRREVRGASSPVEFSNRVDGFVPDEQAHLQRWWVRARGYAWASVDVDHDHGGEWRVELVREGRAIVHATSWVGSDRGAIRLARFARSDQVASWFGFAKEPVVIDGLAPGDYRVIFERANGSNLDAIASRSLSIVAGEDAQISIDLTEQVGVSPRSRLAGADESVLGPSIVAQTVESSGLSSTPTLAVAAHAMHGELDVPREWGSTPLAVELQRLDPRERVYQNVAAVRFLGPSANLDGTGVSRWTAGDLAAGRYLALVLPFRIGVVFDFDPLDARSIDLAVPPPADVCVRVIDENGRPDGRIDSIGWCGVHPP